MLLYSAHRAAASLKAAMSCTCIWSTQRMAADWCIRTSFLLIGLFGSPVSPIGSASRSIMGRSNIV